MVSGRDAGAALARPGRGDLAVRARPRGAAVFSIELSLPNDGRVLPARSEARIVEQTVAREFSRGAGPTKIVLSFEDGDALPHYDAIGGYGDALTATAGVSSVRSLARNDVLAELLFRQYVDGTLEPMRAVALPAGAPALFGGPTAQLVDSKASLRAKAPLVIGYVVAVTFVALLLQFGSLVIPAKAIVMNVASITASFGALVFIFQDGHLQWLLRFEEVGFIPTTIPVLIFAIAFGLSIDYEIPLVRRRARGGRTARS